MAGNVVNVGVLVKTTGLKEGVDQSAQFANNMEKVNTAATKASKAIASSGKAAATASNATNAPTGISTVTDKDYAKVRGAVGTGAAGRDFAKQAQGLGGLVALYATFAANIFAVGAAFEALNKAAQVERLAKATELMSSQVGVNLKSVSKNLVEASGHALSFAEAMQFTNIGTSAGLAGKQVENLTKIAKGAAIALGRDVGDSVRRIIQGTAKQEQEILDELGIFVKSKQAFDKYAAAIGVKVDALTGTQRTQAYANEVERLGKKWEQFAEIDDPFSRFTATGKNALNDLLAGVNSLFTPLLSFLAQSKEGIQGIIVLVATMLSKRALPELGNMLNNIFTFDKQVAISRAIEARSAIGKELAALEKQALETKKAMESIKIGPTTSDTISSGLGVTPYTKGGQKDISATKLANTFNKNPEAYLTILDAEKSTLGIMKEQLKASKNKDLLLSSLIEKGRLEGKSTLDNLILGEKGKGIAIAMNAKANEAIVLERQKVSLAEINLAIEEKTLALKKAGGALTNQQNTLSKLGTAKNAINTAASEGSRAIDAAIPQGFGPFNTKTALATWEAIKSVSAASKTASVGLSGMATASLLASTATNILGIALKGALAFLGPLAMALMTAYTVWSIFGETIKEYLPNWAKVLMGWDEGTKKSEAAKEKLDEYNKSVGYSAAQMQMLNEVRAKGFESVDEEARYADTLLKNIISTTEAYKKYTEEKQTAANVDRLEAARKAGGKGFSEDAFRLRELAQAYKDLVPTETSIRMKVLADNMNLATGYMATAKKGTADYVYWENKLIEARTESARINSDIILPAAQKNAAATATVASAINTVSTALETERKARLKLGDTDLGLNTEAAVQVYRSFEKILTASTSTELKFAGATEALSQVISNGGAGAEVAKQAYISLWQAKLLAIAAGKDGKMDSAIIEEELAKLQLVTLGMSKLFNKPLKSGKVKEYTTDAKRGFLELQGQIDAYTLSLKLADGATSNRRAIDDRIAALRGMGSEAANVAEYSESINKSSIEFAKAQTEAQLTLNKVLNSSTRGKNTEDVTQAREAFAQTMRLLGLTKLQAEEAAALVADKNKTNQIAQEYTKHLEEASRQQDTLKQLAEQQLTVEGYLLEARTASGLYTEKEITDQQNLLDIKNQQVTAQNALDSLQSGLQKDLAKPISEVQSDNPQIRADAIAAILAINAEYERKLGLQESSNALTMANVIAQGLVKSELAQTNDEMAKMESITASLTGLFGELGSAIGKVGEAILKMGQEEKILADQKKAAISALGKDADPKKLAALEIEYGNKSTKQELANTTKIAAAAKGLFKEKSAGYKVMSAVEKASQATTIALELKTLGIKVATWWEGVAAKVATTAAETGVTEAGFLSRLPIYIKEIYASWGKLGPWMVGAASLFIASMLGGGGGSNSSYSGPSGEDLQKAQGTGQAYNAQGILEDTGNGVFGDSTQKLDSINKSLEIIKSTSVKGLDYDNKMLNALYEVANAITGAAKELYTIPGIRQGTNFGTMSGTVSEMGSVESLLSNIPLIGGFLGGIAGSIFGGGTSVSASVEAAGIQLKGTFEQVMNNVVGSITQYKDILKQFSKDGGWFGSDKSWTERSREINYLDTNISSAIADIFVNAKNMFTAVGKVSGVSAAQVDSAFKSMSANVDINIKNLTGEEVLTELNAVVSAKLNEVTKALFYSFEKYKEFGEDLLTTVIRVIDTNTKVTQLMRNLSLVSAENLKGAFELTELLVDAAGGLDAFIDQATYFSENFYTTAEQVIPTQKALIKQLEAMGLASIDTKAELRTLVQGLNLSTEAGQIMYQQLMDLAPGFVEVTDVIIEQSSALKDTISDFKDFSKTLLNFRDSLVLSANSTATPLEKYAEAKTQFERTYALALSGDKDAMGKVTGLSQTFLDTSKTLYASSDQYNRDFNDILNKLEQGSLLSLTSADVAQLQLDNLSIHTDLLSSINENIAIIAGVPTRAQGGRASGLTLVGELGPELVDFNSPGRVYTADQTAGMFTGGASMAPTLNALVIEVNKLRQEVVQLRKDQQKQTGDIIISNYDANQKASDNVATAVVNSSVDSAWVDRSKATIN